MFCVLLMVCCLCCVNSVVNCYVIASISAISISSASRLCCIVVVGFIFLSCVVPFSVIFVQYVERFVV